MQTFPFTTQKILECRIAYTDPRKKLILIKRHSGLQGVRRTIGHQLLKGDDIGFDGSWIESDRVAVDNQRAWFDTLERPAKRP